MMINLTTTEAALAQIALTYLGRRCEARARDGSSVGPANLDQFALNWTATELLALANKFGPKVTS